MKLLKAFVTGPCSVVRLHYLWGIFFLEIVSQSMATDQVRNRKQVKTVQTGLCE